MRSVERALRSVGKTSFIEHYYDYKKMSYDTLMSILNGNYSDNSKMLKITNAKYIFENHLEKLALENIITSDKVDDKIKHIAECILQKEEAGWFKKFFIKVS